MKTVTFIETSGSVEIRVNPDTVESLASNGADDGESTKLTMTSGKTIYVDGTLEEVEAKLKAAN